MSDDPVSDEACKDDPFMEWAKFTGLTNPAYEERLPIAREAWLAGRVELQAEIKRLVEELELHKAALRGNERARAAAGRERMSETYCKMLELSANWDDAESIVQACADYCDSENQRLRDLLKRTRPYVDEICKEVSEPKDWELLDEVSKALNFKMAEERS